MTGVLSNLCHILHDLNQNSLNKKLKDSITDVFLLIVEMYSWVLLSRLNLTAVNIMNEQNFQSLEISRLKYLEFACVTNKIAGLNNSDMI